MKLTRRQLRRIIKEELEYAFEAYTGVQGVEDIDPAYAELGGVVDLDPEGFGEYSFEEETSEDPFWDPDAEPRMIGRAGEDPLPRRSGERPIYGDEDPAEREYYEKWRASQRMPPGSSYRIPSHLRKPGRKLRRR
jgi:hypothetical protein